MASSRDILINILTKGDAKGAGKIKRSLDDVAASATRAGKALTLSVTAPLAAMAALAVRTYAVQEKAELELAAAIKSTGGEVDTLLAKYKTLASEIQQQTIIGDEQTLGLIATATQMGITGDQMVQTIKGAVGLSKAFGLDLTMAARASAAAMQGNTTLLTRYIPQLSTVTDESEKLRLVTEGMARGFSQAEAEAASTTGQIAQAKNAMGDLFEVIGAQLAPKVTVLAKGLKEVAESAQEIPAPALRAGIALGTIAASTGPVLLAVGAITKYRVALTAASVAAGPWLIVAAATAAAYLAIEAAADEAKGAIDNYNDRMADGDNIDAIFSAESEAALEAAVRRTKAQLAGVSGAVADLKKDIADAPPLRANAPAGKARARELEMRLATEAALKGALSLAEKRGQEMVAQNKTLAEGIALAEQEAAAVLAKAAAEKLAAAQLEAQREIREALLSDLDLEEEILQAKIDGEEDDLKKLQDQKRAQVIKNQLQKTGVDLDTATARAEKLVDLQNQAATAEEKRRNAPKPDPLDNSDLTERIALTGQLGQAEQQERKLREGVTAEKFIDLDGKEKERFFERGKLLGDSDQFGRTTDPANPLPAPTQPSPTQPSPIQPIPPTAPNAPDLSPIATALAASTLDLSPILQAIATKDSRDQQAIADLASQIQQLAN